MTKQTTAFGAGLVNALIIGGSLSLVSYAVYQSSQVPILEETLKIELKHVHESMLTLNSTAKDTNENLKLFNKYHAENLGILSKAIATNKHEIARVELECEYNEKRIDECIKGK